MTNVGDRLPLGRATSVVNFEERRLGISAIAVNLQFSLISGG
jgi:hypothetical protein